jgi:hypothetical protein
MVLHSQRYSKRCASCAAKSQGAGSGAPLREAVVGQHPRFRSAGRAAQRRSTSSTVMSVISLHRTSRSHTVRSPRIPRARPRLGSSPTYWTRTKPTVGVAQTVTGSPCHRPSTVRRNNRAAAARSMRRDPSLISVTYDWPFTRLTACTLPSISAYTPPGSWSLTTTSWRARCVTVLPGARRGALRPRLQTASAPNRVKSVKSRRSTSIAPSRSRRYGAPRRQGGPTEAPWPSQQLPGLSCVKRTPLRSEWAA